jgi:hypothetical protein
VNYCISEDVSKAGTSYRTSVSLRMNPRLGQVYRTRVFLRMYPSRGRVY